MATQDVEGGCAPTGDVVDFVILIDNPFGIVTPFGGLSWSVDGAIIIGPDSAELIAGTITPSGSLVLIAPVQCFPTPYTCVTSINPQWECVGACDVPQIIPAQAINLEA